MNITRFSVWAVGALACTACHGGSRNLDAPLNPMTPVAIDDHLVVVDRGNDTALLIDVSKDAAPASPMVLPVVANPLLVVPRTKNPDELLVLSGGQPDDGVNAVQKAGLVAITSTGGRHEYRYDSAYNAIAQSDDGNYAILYFDRNAQQSSGSELFVSNEIAIVDLTNQVPLEVRNLRTFGSSPRSVSFGTMQIMGQERQLAVVLFDSDIAVLDLTSPPDTNGHRRPEFTIRLESQAAGTVELAQTLFSHDEHKIYLRATGSNDIYVVKITDAPGGTPNDFLPSVNPIGAGVGPSDMALYTELDPTSGTSTTRLLVASPGSSSAVIIESDSGNALSVPLPTPGSQIVSFTGAKPNDDTQEPRALFYSPGSDTLEFVDLVDIQSRTTLNVAPLTAQSSFATLLPLDDKTVMLLHQGTGLSQLDLEERTLTEVQGPNLAGAIADPDNHKLWVKSDNQIGFLDLNQGIHPNEVRVDATIQDLVVVPSAKRPRIVATYDNPTGWATVLDATDPTQTAGAFSMRGYLLSGALNGGSQ